MRFFAYFAMLLLMLSVSCTESGLTQVDENGGNNGGGNNGGSNVIWQGNTQAAWSTNNVQIDGNNVSFIADGINSLQSEPIDVSNYSSATLYYGIEFSGETSLKSCVIETSGYGVSDTGGNSWILVSAAQASTSDNVFR